MPHKGHDGSSALCSNHFPFGFFSSYFLFSIMHRAHDEALTRFLQTSYKIPPDLLQDSSRPLTRFLQTSLFLVASPILVKSMFFSFRSSLTLSIQVFLCLPLLLFPSTCPCKAA